MLKKFFEINFFFSNVFVPVVALVLYCGSFAYLSARFLLRGVNYFFVSRVEKDVLLPLAGLLLIALVLLLTRRGNRLVFQPSGKEFYSGDFLLLLLPLTPIVQYIVNNQGLLSAREALAVIIFFIFFSVVCIFAIPALLHRFISTQTLMIVGLAFVFTIVSMASISRYFAWFEKGSLKTQLMFFGSVFLIVWLLYNFRQRKLLHLFIVANLVINSFTQLLSQSSKADDPSLSMEKNQLLSLVGERKPAITPNIYLLIYDAYIPNETMLAHGIDNSAQENYLTEQGFKLYPHTYSIGATTAATLSKVLNASPSYYGEQRRAVSGDGVTQRILKSLNYKTYGLFVSDYMFRGVGEKYDFSIPKGVEPSSSRLIKAVLIGEFRFDQDDVKFEGQARSQFIVTKHDVFENLPGGQSFVFMYTNVPGHSQTSGACRSDETNLYKERLASANSEMRQDLKIITENDPQAIVIIAGDHGPYLTKNCAATSDVYAVSEISRLDIQDRYGTFLAVKWPTGDFEQYDDITVLQDVFPAVFAYLYKDTTILEAKVEPLIPTPTNAISGATVNNGIIYGGLDDGKPLFLSNR